MSKKALLELLLQAKQDDDEQREWFRQSIEAVPEGPGTDRIRKEIVEEWKARQLAVKQKYKGALSKVLSSSPKKKASSSKKTKPSKKESE